MGSRMMYACGGWAAAAASRTFSSVGPCRGRSAEVERRADVDDRAPRADGCAAPLAADRRVARRTRRRDRARGRAALRPADDGGRGNEQPRLAAGVQPAVRTLPPAGGLR